MGTIYIVATPIGNLEDITLRALKILKNVDLIACEDTRHTSVLLQSFNISKPLLSFHQHSKMQKIGLLIEKVKKGQDIAIVTDAGTPGICDPAGVLIEEALKSKIKIVAIPGVSAVTALLSIVGKLTDEFLFLGFLPKKKGRKTCFKQIADSKINIVFFESPHRIIKTCQELAKSLGDREVVIGRELTKKFEEIYRGKIAKISQNIRPQGEFVVFIAKKGN